MATLATIAKPEYDNIIHPQPNGSAYPWSASTGVLDANFGATIGTDNSIQILTQGYTFAWKPDTVSVLDDTGTLTTVDTVNPNAAARVWNNKVTYVGTTLDTSDEFVVEGNQLKHSVRMVAPPSLPDGFTGNPVSLAIGGDIGTTAQDWADIDLWADGTTHLTDFVTSDDLSFRLKSTGKEIYRIPKISITDDAGNEQSGQYKLVFAEQAVTLYMLCPWDWMQQAQYPVVIDPTVIVASAYDTGGNGGRKIVRLSNNWIVASMSDGQQTLEFYVSKDNGQTWNGLGTQTYSGHGTVRSWAIASVGTNVYGLVAWGGLYVASFAFDASTWNGISVQNVFISQEYTVGECSLEIDGLAALHITWSSENSTYQNSYNLRYSKSTDGGTTWATPTQITTQNATGFNYANPCIITKSNNYPVIFCSYDDTLDHSSEMVAHVWNGTSWSSSNCGGSATNDVLNELLAIVDVNNSLHAYWLLSTSLFHAKSTDGGSTWSASDTVYTGTSLSSFTTTYDSTSGNFYHFICDNGTIYEIKGTPGAWGSAVSVGTGTNPQSLWSAYNMNSSDAVRYMYMTGSAVDYASIPLDSPPNAPILNAHANFDATSTTSLSWQFSDPDPGDTQSAFQLQIVDTSTSAVVVDTGKTASVTPSYTLNAGTLTNGKSYQWRVQTWDSSGQQGPYSAYGTFSAAAGPSVTLTTPASGATDGGSGITVQFSYSDSAGNAQQSFQVQLLDADDSTILDDSGTLNGTGNQYTVQYTLANNTSYHARARATNSQGITSGWSDNAFSTSFTPPAPATLTMTPDADNARISIVITNPTPGTGDPTVASNSIYRRITGTSTWSLIASNVPVNGTYHDNTVASGQGYDHKVTSIGNNNTQVDSEPVTSSVTFSGDWVYNPTSGQQFQFLYNRQGYSQKIQEERTEVQTFGSKPMIRRGPLNARTGTLNALMVNNNGTPLQQIQALEADMAPHNAYYLKTAAGEVYKVDLHNVQRAMPVEYLNPQAIGISVDWTEIS